MTDSTTLKSAPGDNISPDGASQTPGGLTSQTPASTLAPNLVPEASPSVIISSTGTTDIGRHNLHNYLSYHIS